MSATTILALALGVLVGWVTQRAIQKWLDQVIRAWIDWVLLRRRRLNLWLTARISWLGLREITIKYLGCCLWFVILTEVFTVIFVASAFLAALATTFLLPTEITFFFLGAMGGEALAFLVEVLITILIFIKGVMSPIKR